MKPIPRNVITTHQLIIHQKKVQMICDFYGHTHPKCKKAVDRDVELYNRFLLQFKVDNDDDDEYFFQSIK